MPDDKHNDPGAPPPTKPERIPLADLVGPGDATRDAAGDPRALERARRGAMSGERKPYAQWGADKSTPAWLIDAARHGRGWPLGQEVTEDEFNQAVYDAANQPIR